MFNEGKVDYLPKAESGDLIAEFVIVLTITVVILLRSLSRIYLVFLSLRHSSVATSASTWVWRVLDKLNRKCYRDVNLPHTLLPTAFDSEYHRFLAGIDISTILADA